MNGPDRDELRIALVMNGGVSLAVWIGGVTREMARLLASPSPYCALLDIVGYDPRIDVVAGTSAGGVNGAFLAMALTHSTPADIDERMGALRDLWVADGAIDRLLRSPFDKDPPSLLDGDGFYYDALRDALAGAESTQDRPAEQACAQSLDLILTATLLRGRAQNEADDFGSSVADTTHRARFLFSRRPGGDDHFTRPRVVEELAVAARSTSSFPAAFEPSFCPVGEDALGRPDMKGLIDEELKHSRFLIDGGILDNKPLDVALERIFKQKASRPARRVLAYVVPDPGVPGKDDRADDHNHPPELLSVVLSSVVEIPSVQSVSAQLQQLRDHNQRVRSQRRGRTLLTRHVDPPVLDAMASDLFQSYRDERIERALSTVIDGLNTGLSLEPQLRTLGDSGRRALLHDLIYEVRDSIPWVPPRPPLPAAAAVGCAADDWRWGTSVVVQLSRICLDLLVREQKLEVPAAASRWERMSDLLENDQLLAADVDRHARRPEDERSLSRSVRLSG